MLLLNLNIFSSANEVSNTNATKASAHQTFSSSSKGNYLTHGKCEYMEDGGVSNSLFLALSFHITSLFILTEVHFQCVYYFHSLKHTVRATSHSNQKCFSPPCWTALFNTDTGTRSQSFSQPKHYFAKGGVFLNSGQTLLTVK